MKMKWNLLLLILTLCACEKRIDSELIRTKIKGGALLQTWKLTWDLSERNPINLAEKTNANWLSLNPIIGFGRQCDTCVFNCGLSAEIYKMREILTNCEAEGIENVMLKPLTSYQSLGFDFWGDFYLETEQEWELFEIEYEQLMYELASLSEDYSSVKLLCIGTELREFATIRPHFFRNLIAKINADFPDLDLTYASNWDEYDQILFWAELDYIGVNPYFPLVEEKTPSIESLKSAYWPIKKALFELSIEYNKDLLFTEYGFRSVDKSGWESWNLPIDYSEDVNMEAQLNGYTAFYETFWSESWVAGGFFWSWNVFFIGSNYDVNNSGWDVNGKPVEELINKVYED